MQEFAVALKQHRQAHGMSQAAIAGAIGVTKQAVQKWEASKARPDIAHWQPVATMLGINVGDLAAMFEDDDDDSKIAARLDALDNRNDELADKVALLTRRVAALAEQVELYIDGGDDTPEPGDPRLDS